MTPNTNKSLSEIFDVELTETDKSVEELALVAKAESIDSLENQRTYVKNNIVTLLEKGNLLLDNLTNIANSTEASKDFQVANDIIKNLVAANISLLEVEVAHKQKPVEQAGAVNNGQVTTNNNTAVFVGSTSELSKYLKDNQISSTLNS